MICALLLADQPARTVSDPQLVAAALLGIATVLLITRFRVHPLLALIFGSALLGIVAGMPASKVVDSFTAGVGATVGSVGLLIALGAMIGALLADSGAADRLVDTVVNSVSPHWLPWAVAGVAALIGLPLFFEVGVVLLVPIVLLVSRRIDVPILTIGIPALAGLSVLHGLVPPHPGPLVAIAALHADLGLTLVFGLIIAVPTVILAGPVFGSLVVRFLPKSGDAVQVVQSGAPVRSSHWMRHSIAADVPRNAERIQICLVVTGVAAGWFGDIDLEVKPAEGGAVAVSDADEPRPKRKRPPRPWDVR